MKFYEELAKYYEDVFPKNTMQLEFLRDIIRTNPKRIMDIACGNGAYAIELAKEGHEVLGIDLSLAMIEKAHHMAHAESVNVDFRACGMLEMRGLLDVTCEVAFCIGNSLVHLNTIQEVRSFLADVYEMMEKEGTLIIQVINYDRILDGGVTSLPTIENEAKLLRFRRNYVVHETGDRVDFKTELSVGEEKWDNSVTLLALRGNELADLIRLAGFEIKAMYGSFKQEPYRPEESFHCITVAQKI